MQGYYHSLETFGTVDGPGLRYVLFLAGCRLGCLFCHNRDTWDKGNKLITVEAVLQSYARYRTYYDAAGGGLTVTGGEPLLQPHFVAALFAACRREGIHTVLDTSGYADKHSLSEVLPYTDHVLFSLKAIREERHKRLTLADNKLILDNFNYTASLVPVTVRYIVIPGLNDGPDDIEALAQVVATQSKVDKVELLPYHTMGRSKWEALGLKYPLAAVAQAEAKHVKAVAERLSAQGIDVAW